MSIKSQKSLNEECSEIIERSYSVRSLSDESLSCSDSEDSLAYELMHRMGPEVLSKLRRRFRRAREKTTVDCDRRVEEVMRQAAAEEGIEFAATKQYTGDNMWLDEEGFVSAVNDAFGNHKYSTHARHLFSLLDHLCTGRAWWGQLMCKLVVVGARRTRSRVEEWKELEVGRVRVLRHCKRETIVKLVSIETEDSFCYAAVTKGGRVGIYGGNMNLLHSYEVFYHRTGIRQRVKNRWITDAVYLEDVQALIFSASDRSLSVYDATTLIHSPLYYVTSMPRVPTCLAYSTITNELAIGTNIGDVIKLRFLQPRLSLFYAAQPDTVNCFLWMELSSPPHTIYTSLSRYRSHLRSVRRVMFAREGDILSCSHDTVGVRVRHSSGNVEDYTLKVLRGVTCFHYIPRLTLVLTGSSAALSVFQLPLNTPRVTHLTPSPVRDLTAVVSQGIVLALCANCWLYIWDLYEDCLLQIIKVPFPFLGVLGKKIEFGTYSIHPGPACCPENRQSRLSSISSVQQSSSGGMKFMKSEDDWETRPLERDPEYLRFNRATIIITCCDCICTLQFEPQKYVLKGPPRGSGAARGGNNTAGEIEGGGRGSVDRSLRSSQVNSPPTEGISVETKPKVPFEPLPELNVLLENAGLQGILEKDFVLMRGLKSDLNKKLAEMSARQENMVASVSAGAPYLSLRMHSPVTSPPHCDVTEQYQRVVSLFPGPSATTTPTGSNVSTPRRGYKSFRLDL